MAGFQVSTYGRFWVSTEGWNARGLHRILIAVVLAASSGTAVAQDIFLQSRHPASKRMAVLDDDGRTAFLYLTQAANRKPVKDAVVYSRVPPVDAVDWARIKQTGETPQLSKAVASSSAVIAVPKTTEFTFRWSADGHSVAVLRNGVPLAFVSMQERFGFSKAVAIASPLANPWDQARYVALFGK